MVPILHEAKIKLYLLPTYQTQFTAESKTDKFGLEKKTLRKYYSLQLSRLG